MIRRAPRSTTSRSSAASDVYKRQMYRDMGGYLITLGSDAHISQNSANSLDAAYEIIKEIGFENIYYYKNRRAIQCAVKYLSLIHISEPTRLGMISYAVFFLKTKRINGK